MVMSTLAFLFSAFLTVCTCASLPYSPTIQYQVHSYDDLREWPSILLKGAIWFKVDVNYLPANVCALVDRANHSDPRGCFILNHDTPQVNGTFRSTYNTSDDLLDFIFNSPYSPAFSRQERHIALCFKTTGFSPCDNSPSDQMWQSLTTTLVNRIQAYSEKTGIHVDFILDGSGTPGGGRTCLSKEFMPYNATWIPDSDPFDAYTSNNVTLGYNRFQVLDVPLSPASLPLWLMIVGTNYGKFASTQYPYLLWEPSDEGTIRLAAQAYLNKGEIHSAGLRYAINIDPVQFQVYAAPCSGTAWHVILNSTFPGAKPKVLVLSEDSWVEGLAIYSPNTSNSDLYYMGIQWPGFLSPAPNLSFTASQPLPSASALSSALLSASSFGTTVLLASASGLALYEWNRTSSSLQFAGASSQVAMKVTAAAILVSGGSTYAVALTSSSSCAFALQTLLLQPSGSELGVKSIGAPVCVADTINDSSSLGTTSIAVAPTASLGSQWGCAAGQWTLTAFVSSEDLLSMYAAVVCLDLPSGQLSVLAGPSRVGVGGDPSVSMAAANGSLLFAAVHGNAFCWNSDPNNKQAQAAVCDLTPQGTPGVLGVTAYTYGRVVDLISHLNAGETITACDLTIAHGVYDGGYAPSTALYSTAAGEVGILELHQGLPALGSGIDVCGPPVLTPYPVLDRWPLPDILSPPWT